MFVGAVLEDEVASLARRVGRVKHLRNERPDQHSFENYLRSTVEFFCS